MSKWKNPPPVCILSGREEYLRKREQNEAVSMCIQTGRLVEYLNGEDGSLSDVLSNTGVLFDEKTLVFLSNPEKANLDLLIEHHQGGENDVAVVVLVEGEIKSKSKLEKLSKALPEKLTAKFSSPKPWERDEWAMKFVMDDFRRNDKAISSELAMAIVNVIGTDLGVLHFEVMKVCYLLDSKGVRDATPEDLRSILAPFSEASALPLIEAIGEKSIARVSKLLLQIKKTTGGPKSSTVLKTMALLNSNLVKWILVRDLLDRGIGTSEISERSGLNEYVLKKNVLPLVRKWSQNSLLRFFSKLVEIERGVRLGWVDTWSVFESVIFEQVTTVE
jgi:DNA polymerase III delta subunit